MISSTGSFALCFLGLYSLIQESLPEILALIFAEAEFHADEKMKAQLKAHIVSDGLATNMERKPVLETQGYALDGQKLAPESRTRSFKTPFKQRNTRPHPNYSLGEEAWLTIEGEYGSFKVFIHTEGEWDDKDQQWKYQVRQTNGRLHADGKLVSEDQLERNQK